jgi:hypothetical protein
MQSLEKKAELLKQVLELSSEELKHDSLSWAQSEPEIFGYAKCVRAFFLQDLSLLDECVLALDPQSCAHSLAKAFGGILSSKRLYAGLESIRALQTHDPTWSAERDYVHATLLRVQGNYPLAALTFRKASQSLADIGVEKKSLRALIWAFDCELKLAQDPQSLMTDYFFSARKLKKLGETKAASIALKRLLGELELEGADLLERELSQMISRSEVETPLHLPDGMSDLEIKLVHVLAKGALDRIDLITQMYPDEHDFEVAETRLKVFLSRFRKKYPDWILRENSKYHLSAPLLTRLRSGTKKVA